MSQFRLNKPFVIYKIQKGKPDTINNNKMTDELAIQFLKVDPARIRVFSQYPENWKEMLGVNDDLTEYKLKELKELYPNVKYEFGMKKIEFIEAINTYNKDKD